MSDYFYLHSLSSICRTTNQAALPEDVYILPCGGARLVAHLASLFLGQAVRPLVLLDGDDAGRANRNALMKELYSGIEQGVLMLPVVLHKDDCEIEDLIGETVLLPTLSQILGAEIALADVDRASAALWSKYVQPQRGLTSTYLMDGDQNWPEGFHWLGQQSSR